MEKKIDYEKELRKAFEFITDNIDVLDDAFTKKVGIPIKFTPRLLVSKHNKGGLLIKVESNSIKETFGANAKYMFKDIRIDFYFSIYENEDGSIGFSASPNFRYDHPSGGSNGLGSSCFFDSIRIKDGKFVFKNIYLTIAEIEIEETDNTSPEALAFTNADKHVKNGCPNSAILYLRDEVRNGGGLYHPISKPIYESENYKLFYTEKWGLRSYVLVEEC